jgi:succinyl-diaminopimelate desuccinylase
MDSTSLLDAVTSRRAALVALAQGLIRIPTLNPPGRHYLDICEYLAGRLEAAGFAVELLRARGAPGDCEAYPRWNLVARREGTRPGDCVHFNGHHDVVEVGHGWTRDPFSGTVEGDRLYGRGACDMKGGIAAAVIAAEAFVATHPDHAGSHRDQRHGG